MPAVTVDPETAERLASPPPSAVERPVLHVTTAPSGLEGDGFPVRRALSGATYEALDPFIMMDQMGEVDYPPMAARAPTGTPIGVSRR
ncbi:MAG: hypothetical protein R2698_02220 [Microthrixaceae bacterium]